MGVFGRKSDKGGLHHSLFNLASDCIFLLEPRPGDAVIVDANEAACAMHGYAKEELIGKPISFLDHPDDREKIPERVSALMRGERVSFELRHVRKDGSAFPIEVSAQMLSVAGKTYILAIDRDITERKQAEERLRLFYDTLEQITDGIQIVDLGGNILYSNKAVENIYGYSPEELMGKHVNSMNVDPEFAGREIIPGIRNNGSWSGELMVKHKGGRRFPIWLNASLVRNNDGVPIAMVGTIRDMTEKKKAQDLQIRHEEELQRYTKRLEDYTLDLQLKQEELRTTMHALDESRSKYLDLFENANDMIFTVDASGRFTSANKAACAGFGCADCKELDGKRLFEVLTEESYDVAEEFVNEAIRQKRDLTEWQPLELVVRRKEGKNFSIEVRARLLIKGEKVYGLQLIARDITVRRELERTLVEIVEELRDEKNFSESIIRSLSSGLLVLGSDEKILTVNPAGKQILGGFARSEEIEGVRLSEIIGPVAARTVSDTGGLRGDLTLQAHNGIEKIIGYTTVQRMDALGAVQGVIVLFADITEARRLEKEMERINRLSTVAEIASAVAHEVRNPLAGIKTMAQSIEENLPDKDTNKEYIVRILRQVDRLNSILREFFDYARPAKPRAESTTLSDIVREILPLVRLRIEKKGIIVHERYEEGLPRLLVDPGQLQQVFLNLFLNSIDAVRQGGEIEISARKRIPEDGRVLEDLFPTRGDYVFISFKDNGGGMPKEVADKIFEPFYTTKPTGTGLGLSIVYRILRENGSAIFVESEAGRGTEFKIFCPSERAGYSHG